MEQVIKTAILWAIGSRNPSLDCSRIQSRRPLLANLPTPPQAENPNSSAGLGRTFEDKVINELLPQVATRLGVSPPRSFYRITRNIAHCGDIAIHYRGQIGLLELKNHKRSLPVTDRRRFFDSILINHNLIDWAILATNRCGVPNFGQVGYVVVGNLLITSSQDPTLRKNLPVGFVCGLGDYSDFLENAIRAVSAPGGNTGGPQWNVSDLLAKGEITRGQEALWGTGNPNSLSHPVGAVF